MYDVRVYPVYPVVMGMQAIHSIGYAFPKPAGAALCPMPVAVGGFAASLPGRAATSKASGDHPNWTQRDEDEAHSMLYKTELCRSYQETGACNYGPKCQFAHGAQEQRPVPRHPRYKTKRCRTFDGAAGTCPYGTRCRFIHQVPEPVQSTTDTSMECVDATMPPPPPPDVTQPVHPPATPTWREVCETAETTALAPPSARRKLVMPAAAAASAARSSTAAAPPPHAPLLFIPSPPIAPTSPSTSLLGVPLRGSQTMRPKRLPIFQSIASPS